MGVEWFMIFAAALTIPLCVAYIAYQKAKFKPALAAGQKWSYKTRDGEEASYFIVGKVEKHPEMGDIAHITIQNINLRLEADPKNPIQEVSHLPFDLKALQASRLKLLKAKVEIPEDFFEGYAHWKETNGGVWSVEISEVLTAMVSS